ncbi:alpha/beta hydrolase [Kocuria rhizosphaericola]|uniref:alpha/beta hydrolase n=1 Tax=Kocuria rhizosphaericola TaxID=3376284 RepID=UPI0037A87F2E
MTARRTFLTVAGQLALVGTLPGCVVERRVPTDPRDYGARRGGGAAGDDREALSARPGNAPPAEPAGPGEHELGVADEGDSLLFLPSSAGPRGPVPLVVSLHGAGGSARGGLDLLRSAAAEHGFAVLAPSSRESTWDAVRGRYGPDVDVLDRSLRRAFELVRVDPERIALAGFSDGASYALGLGLANGMLFGAVMAFSPGFVPPAARTGTPRIFVSHGAADDVLPVDRTSRRIVPQLEEDGYDVTYAEFEGGHAVPPPIVRRAVEWWGRPEG